MPIVSSPDFILTVLELEVDDDDDDDNDDDDVVLVSSVDSEKYSGLLVDFVTPGDLDDDS